MINESRIYAFTRKDMPLHLQAIYVGLALVRAGRSGMFAQDPDPALIVLQVNDRLDLLDAKQVAFENNIQWSMYDDSDRPDFKEVAMVTRPVLKAAGRKAFERYRLWLGGGSTSAGDRVAAVMARIRAADKEISAQVEVYLRDRHNWREGTAMPYDTLVKVLVDWYGYKYAGDQLS